MAKKLRQGNGYPVTLLCKTLELARSSYYQSKTVCDDTKLLKGIQGVLSEFPTYGSRRVTAQLRRQPDEVIANRKRIQRVMRENGLLQPQKRRKIRTTNSQHGYPRYLNLVKDLEITHPEQVWVSDITYIRLGSGFIYLAVIMDLFTRRIRGWQISRTIDQQLTLDALKIALEDYLPEIHHSDQGVQYAANGYTDLLKKNNVQVSMAAIGKAEENGYAERLMRTIKEEEVDLTEYENFSDAYSQIRYFLEDVYQSKRIHSSLGYLTPSEFETAWREEQLPQPSLP